MTGIVVLDVVIGLSFLYALYSLFATIIMEMITSFLGLRARNLEFTIQRMLSDEIWDIKLPKKLGTLNFNNRIFNNKIAGTILTFLNGFLRFLWINRKNPKRSLYHKFFEQPNIKYLSSGGFHNKPSYLSASNFSKAIIDILKDERGRTELSKIKRGIAKLSAIPHTQMHLRSLLVDSNNDLRKFKLLLEDWFEDVQERSTGWFKRTTKIWLLVIGFVIAIGFNADTFKTVEKLSVDPDARQQMVDMATNYVKENQQTIDYIESIKSAPPNPADSISQHRILQERLDSLLIIKKTVQNDISKSQKILASDWNIDDEIYFVINKPADSILLDSVTFYYQFCLLDGEVKIDTIIYPVVHKTIDTLILRRLLPDSIHKPDLINPYPINKISYMRKFVFKNESIKNFWSWSGFWTPFYPPYYLDFENVWGYLLTALAISLGSSFWFDLLNKLIRLRSSIATPSRMNQSKNSVVEKNSNDPASTINRVG